MTDTLQFLYHQLDTVEIADTVNFVISNSKNDLETWFRNPNTLIAITAIIVSVIGVLLSAFHNRRTFRLSRKHNVLSVKPLLNISGKIDSNAGLITFNLKNHGLGPAIIESIKYKYEDIYYDNHMDLLKMLHNRMISKDDINLELYYNQKNEGTIIPPNDSLKLLELNIKPTKYTDSFGDIIEDIKMEISYKDIYNNTFK